jgi:hypothetical protein
MVQECQLSDVGVQPSINTPGAMGDVPALGDAANAQTRSVEEIWEEFEAGKFRIENLKRWQARSPWGWCDALWVAIFGVLLFIPLGVWCLCCCCMRGICSKRSEKPSQAGCGSVSKAGDLLNWWGCTIYTAQEVEEELQSLRDDQVELVEELKQRCGLELMHSRDDGQ